jgi:predicted PurR-regulated permease PerM
MSINGREKSPGVGLTAGVQRPVIASSFTLQTAVGLVIGIADLYLGREVLIPLALALLLSFLLAPPMVRLQRLGLGNIRGPVCRRSFILSFGGYWVGRFWTSI